jgi:FKBP-type peptidyl-prolyl cis-trans isomerase 2
MMAGIENGVIGMEAGDKKSVEIPPEEAFGPRQEELVVEVQKNKLPDHIEPSLGLRLKMQNANGNHIELAIIEIKEETIMLDANHPLAGRALFFDLELVEIG